MAVAQILLVRREQVKKWNWSDVERAADGKLSAGTAKNIDMGKIGTVDTLEQYCQALDLTTIDVLRSVLNRDERPPSAEALTLLRMFDEMGLHEKTILLEVAKRFSLHASASAESQNQPSSAPRQKANNKTR